MKGGRLRRPLSLNVRKTFEGAARLDADHTPTGGKCRQVEKQMSLPAIRSAPEVARLTGRLGLAPQVGGEAGLKVSIGSGVRWLQPGSDVRPA
jgi:hypothetical protein